MTNEILAICQQVRAEGGRALIVGGWVRDYLLGHPSKDSDIEVYGLDPAGLRELLEKIGRVDAVGESFTVYKVTIVRDGERHEIDVSIPRRESKTGHGHRGFTVTGDPSMTVEEAARRRDFTINAILYDPLDDEIIDPFNGVHDLDRRLLRVVDPTTFIDDSLRVLRAMQLAARFQVSIDPETVSLCRSIDLTDLPHERIWGEFEKLLLRAKFPSIGLEAALDLGIIDQLFPQLKAMVGCPQEPEWHPEGDVWIHTRLVLDKAARFVDDLPKEKKITVLLAALCHDLGKPLTTAVVDGRIRSFNHDHEGIAPALALLDTLKVHTINGYDVRAQVQELILNHLVPAHFYRQRAQISDGAFRRLARHCDLDLLYRVAKADSTGRTSIYSEAEEVEWFISRVRELQIEHNAPAPLLMGRHLLEIGLQPGPRIGQILDSVYELQLDGQVLTMSEALSEAKRIAGIS
ncbi:MAG TPA: HD domain-containing protein [Blastocatellia bacterium]|nr:HD domain-containing protein [Blastocatellia bacterium]